MKIDSLFVNIFLLKSVSYWHASICLRRIATLIFWPQYLKLRKYLSLKLYFKYLEFYWHAVIMICWCTQCVHPNTILKFLIGYQNYFSKVIPVWNFDIIYCLGVRSLSSYVLKDSSRRPRFPCFMLWRKEHALFCSFIEWVLTCQIYFLYNRNYVVASFLSSSQNCIAKPGHIHPHPDISL